MFYSLITERQGKFDVSIVRTELNVIYSNENDQNMSRGKISDTMVQSNPQEALPDLCKLLLVEKVRLQLGN